MTISNTIVSGDDGAVADQFQVFGGVQNINSSLIGGDAANIFETLQTNSLDVTTGVLADNGGQVQTIALLANGLAADTGDSSLVSNAQLDTDAQGTGFFRVEGDAVDIGAFEIQLPEFFGAFSGVSVLVSFDAVR